MVQEMEYGFQPSKVCLGVTIDEHLTWNDHVKTVVSKANTVKGFLQHNIKYCPSIVKARCCNSIRPELEYASTFGLLTLKRTLIY